METKSYKLSCYLLGHSEDVRSVAVFNDGTIVSASRDKSAIIWTPNSNGSGYVQKSTLKGHSKFVSSVHVVEPSTEYPKGLILTGGNDNAICIYEPDDVTPKQKITAHKSNVCCLNPGSTPSTFLSSSWDNTARLWNLANLTEPVLTLSSHVAAVWCVISMPKGQIITASADKQIIIWQSNGAVSKKLTGHTDCVRGLARVNDDEFLSCANDAFVKRWNVNSGECLATYEGHSNYIYSICFDPSTMLGVTSGEDYCVKVWQNGEIVESIALPVQSVWCTRLLKNSDVVAATSDGIVRIFTRDPERYADPEELKAYDEAITTQSQMDGIDINNLADSSALRQPGNKDGQIIMIREGDKAIAYSWSAAKQEWEKIGDILGQSKENKPGKQMHNGVEYDFVFSVDIEDGKPPLKLPYNLGQDPWVVAQKFIHDNNLSQQFLEQVANFVIKNANISSVPQSNNSAYADPFTGGSRYVPGSNARTVDSNTDPFTGGSRYVPGFNSSPAVNVRFTDSKSPEVSYIPQTSYLKLEQANTSAIIDKLQEFNNKLTDSCSKVSEKEIETIRKVITENNVGQSNEAVLTIRKLLEWPQESVFPVLDIARLLALKNGVNELLCNEELLRLLISHIKPNALPANQMLTFRLLANMFSCSSGELCNILVRDEVLHSVVQLKSLGNKQNQIALSTYLLNLAVALNRRDDKNYRIKLLDAMLNVLSRFSDHESTFRMLVAIGSLLSSASEDKPKLIETVQQSETALSILTTISENSTDQKANKLVSCSEYIIKLIFQQT